MRDDHGVAIGIAIETPATGNPLPLMHELRHALRRLIESDEETYIDLDALPLAPGERERLLDGLGNGEVTATVDALGATEVSETAFAGIWVVRYRDDNGSTLTTQLEVARTPRILRPPDDNLHDAVARLDRELSA